MDHKPQRCNAFDILCPRRHPNPPTTPSPGACSLSMPKSVQRWVLNMSYSRKDPGSSNTSSRSLADSLPLACCRAKRFSPPPANASFLVSSKRSRKTRFTSGTLTAGAGEADVLSGAVLVDVEVGVVELLFLYVCCLKVGSSSERPADNAPTWELNEPARAAKVGLVGVCRCTCGVRLITATQLEQPYGLILKALHVYRESQHLTTRPHCLSLCQIDWICNKDNIHLTQRYVLSQAVDNRIENRRTDPVGY